MWHLTIFSIQALMDFWPPPGQSSELKNAPFLTPLVLEPGFGESYNWSRVWGRIWRTDEGREATEQVCRQSKALPPTNPALKPPYSEGGGKGGRQEPAQVVVRAGIVRCMLQKDHSSW